MPRPAHAEPPAVRFTPLSEAEKAVRRGIEGIYLDAIARAAATDRARGRV